MIPHRRRVQKGCSGGCVPLLKNTRPNAESSRTASRIRGKSGLAATHSKEASHPGREPTPRRSIEIRPPHSPCTRERGGPYSGGMEPVQQPRDTNASRKISPISCCGRQSARRGAKTCGFRASGPYSLKPLRQRVALVSTTPSASAKRSFGPCGPHTRKNLGFFREINLYGNIFDVSIFRQHLGALATNFGKILRLAQGQACSGRHAHRTRCSGDAFSTWHRRAAGSTRGRAGPFRHSSPPPVPLRRLPGPDPEEMEGERSPPDARPPSLGE